MPRYFFDVEDNTGTHRDDVGLDLPDMDTAILEGRRALADMSREALLQPADDSLQILIRDGADGPVRLALSMTTDRPHKDGAGS